MFKHYSEITLGDEDYILNALDTQLYEIKERHYAVGWGEVKVDPVAKKLYEQWLADYKEGKDVKCYFSHKMRHHYPNRNMKLKYARR